MSDFKAKCTKFDFRWGSHETQLGELTVLIAVFMGAYF